MKNIPEIESEWLILKVNGLPALFHPSAEARFEAADENFQEKRGDPLK
jgi:hypothetical protein